MDGTERIAVTDMATLIDAGEARELLDFVALGPALHNGQWWYIAADAPDKSFYIPAPADLAAKFGEHHDRITRLSALTAEAQS